MKFVGGTGLAYAVSFFPLLDIIGILATFTVSLRGNLKVSG